MEIYWCKDLNDFVFKNAFSNPQGTDLFKIMQLQNGCFWIKAHNAYQYKLKLVAKV